MAYKKGQTVTLSDGRKGTIESVETLYFINVAGERSVFTQNDEWTFAMTNTYIRKQKALSGVKKKSYNCEKNDCEKAHN